MKVFNNISIILTKMFGRNTLQRVKT